MPRVTLATQSHIESYISLLKQAARTMSGTRTPCEDVRVARQNLEFFSAFRDKAFKAFYARKILQLPPVIAAQVFDVSNGLISQAAGDRNVYSAANANNSSSNELGVFNLPGGGVVATTMNNDERQEIFKAFARIAIIKNRGVDVPNFQNRMVAGYMSESDADAFRATMQTIASVYANCPEMQTATQMGASQTSATPHSEGLAYRRTNTVPIGQGEREQVIIDLIAAGADRDQAQRLMRELLDLGFNLTIRSRSGNELSYRLFYYGQMSDAPSSADLLAVIISGLNLSSTDVSMGLRGEDLVGTIRFSRQSAAQPESTITTTLTSVRNPNGLNSVEMSDLRSLLDSMNYPNTFLPALNQATPSENRIIGFQVTGENAESLPMRVRIFFKFDENQTDAASFRFFNRIRQAAENQGLGGIDFWGNFEAGEGDISYELSRLPESTSTASTEPTATTPTVAGAREIGQEYMDLSPRVQSSIDADDYLKLREAGYSKRDVQALVDFIGRYGLKIVTIFNRSAVGQMPPNLRISVVGRNPSARSFRNGTFLNFLRARMNSIGNTDAEVQVLAPGGRPYQSATFRGTGRGQTPRGTLIIPMGNQQTQTAASASQTQADRSPNQGIRFVGYQFADAGRLFRSGSLPFIMNSQVRGGGRKSYMLYWWSDINEQFYQLPAGQMDLRQGSVIPIYDTLNRISQSTPGKLKLYTTATVNALVASALRSMSDTPSFAPQRISGQAALELNVADYDFFTDAYSNEPQRARRIMNLANAVNVDVTGTEQTTASTVTDAQARQVSQMPFTNTLGFEFEGGGSQGRQQTAATLTRLGVPCNFEGYNHTTRAQWKIVTDATLSGVQNGMELVSPILTGEEGLKDLGKCLRATQEAGMFIHEQGGVHIHMGNQQWDLQHRKNILLNQVKVQKFFLKTIPQYREDMARQWARPFNTDRSFTDRIRNANDIQTLSRVTGTRYMLINITNTRQPTWEWRYPTGSLEVDTNVYSARLIDKLVQVSKFGELPASMTSGEGMKTWMGQDIFSFWKNRIYELSQTKGSTRRPSSN